MVVIDIHYSQMLVVYSQIELIITYKRLNKWWFILGISIALVSLSEDRQIIAP